MAALDHWHPVLRSSELKTKPVGIRLAGREFVLFRTASGRPGALDDCCLHRRMRLSCGSVCGERVQCAYHGWTFDADGNGESPGTPKLHANTASYDAAELQGLVWIRNRGSQHALPTIETNGGIWAGLVDHRIEAPLELVLDNFTEVEHTATVHTTFGFPLNRLNEAVCRHEAIDDEVRTTTRGPSKSLGWFLNLLLGVGPKYDFHSDWTTRFSPPHTVVDHYWIKPGTTREGMVRWRFYHFFTPIDDATTRLWTLAFVTSRYPVPGGGVRMFRWLMRRKMIEEIDQDKFILENLADKNVAIEGLKLGRFDRPLGLNRERLASVYRGTNGPRQPEVTPLLNQEANDHRAVG